MSTVIDILIYVATGAALSWYYFYWKQKELLGGYVGGLIVGLLGAVLGGFLLSGLLNSLLDFIHKSFG